MALSGCKERLFCSSSKLELKFRVAEKGRVAANYLRFLHALQLEPHHAAQLDTATILR